MTEDKDKSSMDKAMEVLDTPTEELPLIDGVPMSAERREEITKLGTAIIDEIKGIYDPEIPVNIYDLGLIYKIDVEDDNAVAVEMTLTSPHCPVAEILPIEVQDRVAAVEGVTKAKVEIVWEPPWNPQMMTEEAQLELGMMY